MYKDLDVVVLRRDIPGEGLENGDLGTIVTCYKGGGYELEFITAEGDTIAVVTLTSDDIRPVARREIFHIRELNRITA